MIFMTTNHIDRLDPALIRPGRVDFKFEMRNATKEQAASLFDRFFPDCLDDAHQFGNVVEPESKSMAELQSILLNSPTVTAALTAVKPV